MKPFMSQTASERLNAVYRTISPRCVLGRSQTRYMSKTGATTARGGMNRVDSTKKSQSLAPGIRNRLKPYAHEVPSATEASVLSKPITTLFHK